MSGSVLRIERDGADRLSSPEDTSKTRPVSHGGHNWDTDFDLLEVLAPLAGDVSGTGDVDALEAALRLDLQVAGGVPDGSGPQVPLIVVRMPSGDLTLSWGNSCLASDTDYEIYQGTLGVHYSHTPVVCSTGGLTTVTFTEPAGSAYYVVVPTNGFVEGSYGLDSNGTGRPQGGLACLPAVIPSCL